MQRGGTTGDVVVPGGARNVGAQIRFEPGQPLLPARGRRGGLVGFSFLVFVVLPTLVGATFLAFAAPHAYEAEFRVVIREAAPSTLGLPSGALGAISMALGQATGSAQNAFMVSDYLKSRDIVQDLGGKDRMLAAYSGEKAGWMFGLTPRASAEKIWRLWQSKVRTDIDLSSGILTVKMRAYSAADAYGLARDSATLSEAMINRVSERSRQGVLERAQAEMERAREQVIQANQQVLQFRNAQQVIDPAKNAETTGVLITDLTKEKMNLQNQRAAMGPQMSGDSPVSRLMADREANIDRQIGALRGQLTNTNAGRTASAQLAVYENLQLRSKFAEEMYKVSQTVLEAARQTKERQQLYLMMIVNPSLPEQALYPRLGPDTFLVFGICLVFWSIGTLIAAAILDHVR